MLSSLILLAMCLCAPHTASAQSDYRAHISTDHGYHFTIPEGWDRIDQGTLLQETQGVPTAEFFEFESAFQPRWLPRPFTGPHITVKVAPYSTMPIDGQPNRDEIQQLLNDRVGPPNYDDSTHSVSGTLKAYRTDGSSHRADVRGWFGRHAYVQIAHHPDPDRDRETRAAFETIVNSFQFTPDAAYDESANDSDLWAQVPWILLCFAIFGLFALVSWVMKPADA